MLSSIVKIVAVTSLISGILLCIMRQETRPGDWTLRRAADANDASGTPPGAVSFTLSISMPYSRADFDEGKQASFKTAIAALAKVDVSSLWINITDLPSPARRFLAEANRVETSIYGIGVETRIYGGNTQFISKNIGSGNELLGNLNKQLALVGLAAALSVDRSDPSCARVTGLTFCAHLNGLNGSVHFDSTSK